MSTRRTIARGQVSLELRFQALGRILDRRPNPVKELCILQAGDGFVVHLLEGVSRYDTYAFAPATIVIEAAELTAAMDDVVRTSQAHTTSWWQRR